MFKVPEWGSDIPKSTVDFSKKVKDKKAGNKNVDNKKQQMVSSPQKAKNNGKQKEISSVLIKKKNKKRNRQKHLINEDTNNFVPKENGEKRFKKVSVDFSTPYKKNEVTNLARPMKSNAKVDKKTNIKMSSTNNLSSVRKSPKKRKLGKNANKINKDETENYGPAKTIKIKFTECNTDVKKSFKKERLKKLLEQNNNRTSINVSGNKLRERMLERLKAAQFRYLNEKLYTSSGNEAKEIFQADPDAFKTYHQGYQQQVKKWPVNPLDVIVKKIKKMPKTCVIADMGCGEGALSKRVPQTVHSFDLVASSPGVVACDMAHTPLLGQSVDVVVYCLALMGTELTQYLVEANRVLKSGGQLLIAEVESRFDDINAFTKDVEKLGFKLKNLDKEHSVFFFLHFLKNKEPPAKKSKLPAIQLKPCLYKKR